MKNLQAYPGEVDESTIAHTRATGEKVKITKIIDCIDSICLALWLEVILLNQHQFKIHK
jgi:hypothetical protein